MKKKIGLLLSLILFLNLVGPSVGVKAVDTILNPPKFYENNSNKEHRDSEINYRLLKNTQKKKIIKESYVQVVKENNEQSANNKVALKNYLNDEQNNVNSSDNNKKINNYKGSAEKTKPEVPANLKTYTTNAEIIVVWNSVTNADEYELEVDGNIVNCGAKKIYFHSNLLVGTTHTYRVRSKNSAGTSEWSEYISEKAVITKLSAPENITTSTSDDGIKITWDKEINALAYDVQVDGTIYDNGESTEYINNTLDRTDTHVFRIRAKNGDILGSWSQCYIVKNDESSNSNISDNTCDSNSSKEENSNNDEEVNEDNKESVNTVENNSMLENDKEVSDENTSEEVIDKQDSYVNSSEQIENNDENNVEDTENTSESTIDNIENANMDSVEVTEDNNEEKVNEDTIEVDNSENNSSYVSASDEDAKASTNNSMVIVVPQNDSELNNTNVGILKDITTIDKEFKVISGNHSIINDLLIVNNNLYINGGSLDLNGKTLIVNGNLFINGGTLNINGGKIIVNGDIIQNGGSLIVNGGYASIEGNYTITGSSRLTMTNENDIVEVGGSFSTSSTISEDGNLTNGTLKVKGNVTQVNGNSNNFNQSNNFCLEVNGDDISYISIDSTSSKINRIDTINSFGVIFITNVCIGNLTGFDNVIGDLNVVNSQIKLIDNTNKTEKQDLVVNCNLNLLSGTIDLSGSKLVVNGNLEQTGGTVSINKGKLVVNGDYTITGPSYLSMVNELDYVLVNGNFVMKSDKMSYGNGTSTNCLCRGTLEVKGDVTEKKEIMLIHINLILIKQVHLH